MRTSSAAADIAPYRPSRSPRGWFEGWNRFWFSPADPTTLGLIRLCGGFVTFYVILVYTFDLPKYLGNDAWVNDETVAKLRFEAPWVTPPINWQEGLAQMQFPEPATEEERKELEAYKASWGVDRRACHAVGNVVWSIWYHVTDPTGMMVVHLAILTAIFLFAIGFGTRVTSVLTWLGTVSYIHRAPTTLFGMDTMMNIMLVYLMIGPSGAALSVDRLLARWWTRRQALKQGRLPPADVPSPPLVSANFVLRLMQIHFCIIYMASGLSKLQGSMWWNGTAVWGTMANASFNPLDVGYYHAFLVFLSKHRWLWEVVIGGSTFGTVALEISLPFLIWSPRLRWVMICGAVMLHTGIALIMGLIGFGLFMLCLLLSFVPGEVVRRLLDNMAQGVQGYLSGLGLPSAVPEEKLALGR